MVWNLPYLDGISKIFKYASLKSARYGVQKRTFYAFDQSIARFRATHTSGERRVHVYDRFSRSGPNRTLSYIALHEHPMDAAVRHVIQ